MHKRKTAHLLLKKKKCFFLSEFFLYMPKKRYICLNLTNKKILNFYFFKVKKNKLMENVFNLKGVLKNTSNHVVPNAFLAIVDDDFLYDDLIGIGTTDAEGKFSLSFLQSEFCQDAFDIEKTPDIRIIVSSMFGSVRKTIFERAFPKLDWSNNQNVDLGDIIMEGVDVANPIPIEKVDPLPGYKKRAKRLNINNEMVAYCLAEVAPLIEKFTGWHNLLDGLKVEVVDNLAPIMLREIFVGLGKDANSTETAFSNFFSNYSQGAEAGCALYDPHIHTIAINKSIMEQVGIDALKVICGHELVHVGQMKYTLGLKAYNLHHLRSLGANPETIDIEKAQAQGSYITELEGYAQYIQVDFLQKYYYRMVNLTYHASTFEKIMQGFIASSKGGSKAEVEAKTQQSVQGLEIYRKRQVGDAPVRFEFDVATLPGGEAFVEKAKQEVLKRY